MTMICHQLNTNIPEDVAFGEARVRAQSAAAEDLLHDMGAISIFGTDTQGMGRLATAVIVQSDKAALGGEGLGQRRADAGRGAGDQHRLAGEVGNGEGHGLGRRWQTGGRETRAGLDRVGARDCV